MPAAPPLQSVMSQLKAKGTAQNRRVYARHGAPDSMLGVSFGDLNAMAKKLKIQHELALELWDTGVPDAQTLATLIADPNRITSKQLDGWVRSMEWFMVGDYFCSKLVIRTPHAEKKLGSWTKRKAEYVRRCGYGLLGLMARDKADRPDSFFEPYIGTIESEIHGSANRAREAMNGALVSVGKRNSKLHKKALAAARRIGPVEVFHGEETQCKTENAVLILTGKMTGRTR